MVRPFPWDRLDLSYTRYPNTEVHGCDLGETAGKTKAFTIINGKHHLIEPPSILEFARTHHDCIVIVDATLYSYEHDKRTLLIQEAAANNVILLGKQTRHEARLRSELDIDKSDENDAQLAYYIARHTKFEISVLRELPPPEFLMEKSAIYPPGTKVITTWQAYANYMRRSGTQLRKDWVKSFLADIPPFKALPAHIAKPLGNSAMTNYDRDFILLAVAVARDARFLSSSSKEFRHHLDREWGWFGGGHRGYPRSTFYRRAATLAQREVKPLKLSDIAWKKKDRPWEGDLPLRRKHLKEQMRALRRAVRSITTWELLAHYSP